jgi:hypothetical protein
MQFILAKPNIKEKPVRNSRIIAQKLSPALKIGHKHWHYPLHQIRINT